MRFMLSSSDARPEVAGGDESLLRPVCCSASLFPARGLRKRCLLQCMGWGLSHPPQHSGFTQAALITGAENAGASLNLVAGLYSESCQLSDFDMTELTFMLTVCRSVLFCFFKTVGLD